MRSSKAEAGASQDHRYYRRVTRRTTTICWGVVLALSPLLPRVPVHAVQSRPNVPISLPFEFAWAATLDTPGRASLLATRDHLIVSTIGGALAAYEPATGAVVWTNSGLNPEVAPVAGEGLIFLASQGRLRAIAEATGAARWEDREASLSAAPPVWRAGWLLAQTSTGLRAYRAADGVLVWKSAEFAQPLSGPLTIDGDLVFAVAGKKILAIALPTGDMRWTTDDLETNVADVLAAHERVYFSGADGRLYCLRQSDGRQLWASPRHPRIVGRPVTDEASVYFVSLDNQLRALERFGGNQRWKAGLDARPTPGLALANGRVVVPLTTGELVIHATKTGQQAGVLPIVQPGAGAGTPSKLEAIAATDAGVLVRLTTSSGGVQTLIAYRPATFVVQPAATLPGTMLDLFGPRLPHGHP